MRAKLCFHILTCFAICTISFFAYQNYYSFEKQRALAQITEISALNLSSSAQQLAKPMAVKIDYPVANQEVPVGELNISGSSTDTASTDCNVQVDINDVKPFQNTTATGTEGPTDYSTWTFTYTEKYKLITEGTNELTAKLSCEGNDSINSTSGASNTTNSKSKWNSINVTGVVVQGPDERTQNQTQNETASLNIIQGQKVLDDQESGASSPGVPMSQDNVAPTKDQMQNLGSFESPTELTEMNVNDKESSAEDTFYFNDEPEQGELKPLQMFGVGEDEVVTDLMDENLQEVESDTDNNVAPTKDQMQNLGSFESPTELTEMNVNDKESSAEDTFYFNDEPEQGELKPLQMFGVGEDEVVTDLMDENLQEVESDTENQEGETRQNDYQVNQHGDDVSRSAEDIYSMITGNLDEGNDLGDIAKSDNEDSELDTEDLIVDETSLVQAYIRNIQEHINGK